MRSLPFGLLLFALVSSSALAGCLNQNDSEAILLIDYGGAHRDDDGQRVAVSIAFHKDDRPSEGLYEARDLRHPDYFTGHDLMSAWAKETGMQVEWSYFQGLGFAMKTIDFVRCDFSLGDECFWQLIHNGEPSQKGMSELRVRDGDSIEWTYTPF